MLDRRDAPRSEGPSVAQVLHLIDDRSMYVAWQDEIGVQRMSEAVLWRRSRRSNQGLRQDLAAEHALRAQRTVLSSEDVELNRLEVQKVKEVV